ATLAASGQEAENQAGMAVETARSRAEQRLQELRAELAKLQLHCDVVLPAEAQRKAAELRAAGEAAPAIENGKAGAEALRLVAATPAKSAARRREARDDLPARHPHHARRGDGVFVLHAEEPALRGHAQPGAGARRQPPLDRPQRGRLPRGARWAGDARAAARD